MLRTAENGASESEVEAATKHIGRLIMEFPELLIAKVTTSSTTGCYGWSNYSDNPGGRSWADPVWGNPTYGFYPEPEPVEMYKGTDTVLVHHSGVKRQTSKAVLFAIAGEQVWLPRSQIADFNSEHVMVSSWLAAKKGFV